jgi:hypothetical protein
MDGNEGRWKGVGRARLYTSGMTDGELWQRTLDAGGRSSGTHGLGGSSEYATLLHGANLVYSASRRVIGKPSCA